MGTVLRVGGTAYMGTGWRGRGHCLQRDRVEGGQY